MRFSIIVPIYNVEKYLPECVDSIMAQTFADFEVLLIDDGSKDSSGTLCDQYGKKYENIHVFHKENGGLSDARNYGIERARGEYLLFVDSDDWIDANSLLEFDRALKDQPDVLVTRFVEVFGNVLKYKDESFPEYLKIPFSKQRALDWNLQHSENTWPAPKYVVKNQFVQEKNMRFEMGRYHEDVDWSGNLFYKAETYSGCTLAWYYHRMNRPNSITTVVRGKSIVDTIEIAEKHYAEWRRNPSEIRKQVVQQMVRSAFYKISQIKFCLREEKPEVLDCIKRNREIFKMAISMKHRIFVVIMSVLGVELAVKLLEKR